ncbi:MAG TPA: CPBP family glutamic-type intramembrane protease [Acidimicrobiales bacterium]|nr:CPBP family glutamic-type intramembrane protease [Acidimicrobiales bacterium]
MSSLVVLAALVVATGMWAFMFVPDRRGIWTRTWIAAAVLSATAVGGLLAVGRLGEIAGPIDATELAIGLGAGGVWLVATHVGYRIIAWLFPSFGAQVRDLYRLREGDATTAQMVGPIVAMGIAEELLFRGVLQGVGGFAVALVAYTAVQVFERKWALAFAALLGGAVWGALFAWRVGLVAPVAAHVLWTGVLTFLWPLGDGEPVTATRPGTAPAARA